MSLEINEESYITNFVDRLVPNSSFEFRGYQNRQLNFLKRKLISQKVIGLQSGTGSGKTFIAIEMAMDQLRKNPKENVAIVTPFNHLVLLMAKRAIEYGFKEDDVRVLMGKGRVNCPVTWKYKYPNKKYEVFSEDHCECSDACLSKSGGKICASRVKAQRDHWNSSLSKELVNNNGRNEVYQEKGKLIITNDSMFLVSKDLIKPSLVIIDEAHVFDDYYHSYKREEISPEMFRRVNKIIDSNQILQSAFVTAYREGKPISETTYKILQDACFRDFEKRRKIQRIKNAEHNREIEDAIEKVKNGTATQQEKSLSYKKLKPVYSDTEIAEKVSIALKEVEILSIQNDYDVYINMDQDDYYVDKFYYRLDDILDDKYKIILMSATIDDYTKIMFDMPDSNLYIEKKQFIDYSKSEFFTFPTVDGVMSWEAIKDSMHQFLNLVKSKQSGLLLFTTIDFLRRAEVEFDNIYGFKFFRSIEEFEVYNGKKILIGSKSLFQGMDIPGLDFVAIDKLPFLNYNEEEQKLGKWLEIKLQHKGFNVWKQRTIPLLVNNIIQATGRLWRGVDDYGAVAVLDPRGTYNYLDSVYRKAVTEARPGIEEWAFFDKRKIDPESEDGFIFKRDEVVSFIKDFNNKKKIQEEEDVIPVFDSEKVEIFYDEDFYIRHLKFDGDEIINHKDIEFFEAGRQTKRRKYIIGQWKAAHLISSAKRQEEYNKKERV